MKDGPCIIRCPLLCEQYTLWENLLYTRKELQCWMHAPSVTLKRHLFMTHTKRL